MQETISSDRVEDILKACLFHDDEIVEGELPENAILVEGVLSKFGLHKDRVEAHREEILSMLALLPDDFMAGKGGGMSFLNACTDKHGHLWTGLHLIVDHLFVLGQAIGAVKCALPRLMWSMLPGSMPYYIIDLDEVHVQQHVERE